MRLDRAAMVGRRDARQDRRRLDVGRARRINPHRRGGLAYTDGENLLIADTPQDFAAAISRLVHNADLTESLRQASRHTAIERYGWRSVYTAWDAIYPPQTRGATNPEPSPTAHTWLNRSPALFCSYLGLFDDRSLVRSADRVAPLLCSAAGRRPIAHQGTFCLSGNYAACPLYQAAAGDPRPHSRAGTG